MKYTTETRLGQDYFVSEDGYGSFNESYVQEHVDFENRRERPTHPVATPKTKKAAAQTVTPPETTTTEVTPDPVTTEPVTTDPEPAENAIAALTTAGQDIAAAIVAAEQK